jgi:hypothetical protein
MRNYCAYGALPQNVTLDIRCLGLPDKYELNSVKYENILLNQSLAYHHFRRLQPQFSTKSNWNVSKVGHESQSDEPASARQVPHWQINIIANIQSNA